MNIISFSINIVAPVGVLGDTKVKKLHESLKDYLPIVASVDMQNAVLVNPEKPAILIVNPGQITINMEGQNIYPDFDYFMSLLHQTFDTLLLDSLVTGGIRIVGHIPFTEDTMDYSFNFITTKKEDLIPGIKGLRGVGLRFLLDHGQDMWEYKVEPFIKDPRSFFIEAICGFSQPITIENVIETAKEAYTYFTGDWESISRECLIGRG